MTRQKPITQDDVSRFCVEIVSIGKVPTLDLVRKRLGHRGSFSTIQPFLKFWRDENKDTSPPPSTKSAH